MFEGNTKTQVWARDVLKILVERAQARRTITLSELTNKLELQGGYYNLLMGKVFKHIIKTLAELDGKEKYRILHL